MVSGMSIRVGFAVLSACAVTALVVSADARAAETLPPWAICLAEAVNVTEILEQNMSPADGATVQEGTTVAFSGSSSVPVEFAVASSAELLANPDIESGPGSASPGSSVYTFTSAKATAAMRTVYWSVSFSDASLPQCAGQTAQTYTTKPRSLTVVPNVAAEREAREAKEREAAAKQTAERRAAERAAAARQCVVPRLKGDTLSKARRLLIGAHCRLGRVSRPRGREHGALVVVRQSQRPGRQLAAGARVMVRLAGQARARKHL